LKLLRTSIEFINSLFNLSFAHLRKIFDEYQKKVGKPIEDTIKGEFSGNIAKTYLALSIKL
jgi:hypothetical protein